jgi:hypothetical protein
VELVNNNNNNNNNNNDNGLVHTQGFLQYAFSRLLGYDAVLCGSSNMKSKLYCSA